jgi:exportin-1
MSASSMMMSMDQVAASLVKQFDLSVLDQLVSAAYDPVHPQRGAANKALMQLQEAPELWTKADEMIEKSTNPQTRFFGLQVLDDAIKTR